MCYEHSPIRLKLKVERRSPVIYGESNRGHYQGPTEYALKVFERNVLRIKYAPVYERNE